MAQATRATAALDRLGVPYRVVSYTYDPAAERIGMQAAQALGADPDTVIKTLMAKVDGKPVCVMLSSVDEVSMKKLASAAGGKKAEMMAPGDAERISGYRIGGISPFAQQRKLITIMDQHVVQHSQIYVNAGQRGLQLWLNSADAVRAVDARVADIKQGSLS